MSEIRTLLETLDAINETPAISTVATGEAFLKDVAKAFGGVRGQKLNIVVTLKGTNVLEYSIAKVTNPASNSNDSMSIGR
jgi:hypothetical protein